MKIKAFISSFFVFSILFFIACDDDLNGVGGTITPNPDLFILETDTVQLTSRTISLNDSVYAKSRVGLLGEYIDPIFGSTYSDFLAEFYSPEQITFRDRTFSIDSVDFGFQVHSFIGDSTKLMGLSVYELTTPLDGNYFTNIDPKDFCDLKKPLAQGSYIYKDAIQLGKGVRGIQAKADTLLGKRFFDEWTNNRETFENPKKFKEFFPGIYTTTTYGSDGLVSVTTTNLNIYYSYKIRNYDNTKDSTLQSLFQLYVTNDVVQMNRVKNKYPEGKEFDEIFNSNPERAYLKTPAGVVTEIEIPLREILSNIGENKKINSATFFLRGVTREEELSKLGRPSNLLFINKDSVENFFVERKLENNVTSYLMTRSTSSTIGTGNTYHFLYSNSNLSRLVTYYMDMYKGKDIEEIPVSLKYLLIPVDRAIDSSTTGITSALYNMMAPTVAILLTDEKSMQFKIVYSQF